MSKTVRTETGEDITEPVQILYDIAHSSMDWGSGFLDNEEMEAVIRLAVLMGWQVPELPSSGPMVTVAQKFPEHYEATEHGYCRVRSRPPAQDVAEQPHEDEREGRPDGEP